MPYNPSVYESDIHWVKVPDDFYCAECRARGWMPQSGCPMCSGEDECCAGVICAQCEFCGGC